MQQSGMLKKRRNCRSYLTLLDLFNQFFTPYANFSVTHEPHRIMCDLFVESSYANVHVLVKSKLSVLFVKQLPCIVI
jgi:hypothetical protein